MSIEYTAWTINNVTIPSVFEFERDSTRGRMLLQTLYNGENSANQFSCSGRVFKRDVLCNVVEVG